MIRAVVLAAGGSTRMGRPKQLAELDGRPLLAHVLGALDGTPADGRSGGLKASAPVDRGGVALGGAAERRTTLTVRVDNLVDTAYEEILHFPARGRTVWLGARAVF